MRINNHYKHEIIIILLSVLWWRFWATFAPRNYGGWYYLKSSSGKWVWKVRASQRSNVCAEDNIQANSENFTSLPILSTLYFFASCVNLITELKEFPIESTFFKSVKSSPGTFMHAKMAELSSLSSLQRLFCIYSFWQCF